MGQKVNAISLRLGVNKTWDSRWYAEGDAYADQLHADLKIEKFIRKNLESAGIATISIERPNKKLIVTINTARPGVVIGKKGADIEKIKKEIAKFTSDEVSINIVPVAKPELDAKLVAEGISQQLAKRGSFRRAMKRAVQSSIRLGAEGIRINCSGRLGGAEIARMEWYREGRVPLHTLRGDIDYATAESLTAYGIIGIKVWVFKGEKVGKQKAAQTPENQPEAVAA